MAKFDDYKFTSSTGEVESSEKKVPIIGLGKQPGPNIKFSHKIDNEDVKGDISAEKNHSGANKIHRDSERPENSKEPALGGELSRKLQTPVRENVEIQESSENEAHPLILHPTEPELPEEIEELTPSGEHPWSLHSEQLEKPEESPLNAKNSWTLHPTEPELPEETDDLTPSGEQPWSLHSEQLENPEESPLNAKNSWTLHPTEPELPEETDDLTPSGEQPWSLHSEQLENPEESPLNDKNSWTLHPTEPELPEETDGLTPSEGHPITLLGHSPRAVDQAVDPLSSEEQPLTLHRANPEHLTLTKKSTPAVDKLDRLTTGQQLANTRKSLNLTVKEVAEFFHLPVTTIEAIENNDYEKLYGVAYATGHVRAYANYLNLDAGQLIENDPVLGVIPALEMEDLDLSQTTERKRRSFGFRTKFVRLVIFALITGAAIVGWQHRDTLGSLVNGLLAPSEATTTIETPSSNPDSSESNTNLIHSDRLS